MVNPFDKLRAQLNEPSDMIRAAEVRRLTGWDRRYLLKLRRLGVVKAWQPFPGAWPWYSRTEILKLSEASLKGQQ